MTHRYHTRFQMKKFQEEQRRLSEVALEKTVKYSSALMTRIDAAPTFMEKLELLTLLYQHLYEEPLLLTKYERFRTAAWEKMKEQEAVLLDELQTLPPRLAENNTYDMRIRVIIHRLLDLMEKVRIKYW